MYTVAQNTSVFTIASVLQKVVSFVYFILIARLIGVENTGAYFFALAFSSIFLVVADLGLNTILTRESSKYPAQANGFLNNILITKIFTGLLAYIFLALSAYALGYPVFNRNLILLAGVTVFFDNLHSVFYTLLRARQNLLYEGVGIVASQIITLVVGTLALIFHAPLYFLILAYGIASVLNVIYAASCAYLVCQWRFNFVIDKILLKKFFIFALPIALSGVISRLYAYSDSLLMSKMLPATALGLWSVPYKVTFAFQFVPIALAAGVYPAMSASVLSAKERVGDLFAKSWRYLFTIIFPLVFGLLVLAKPFLVFVYGKNYTSAGLTLQILSLGLIFGFLSFIITSTLTAFNRQKIQTIILAIAWAVNVGLNLWLLPKLGINGAAISATIGNLVIFAIGLWFVNKEISIDFNTLGKYFLQTFLPALAMAGVIWALLVFANLHVLILAPIGVVIYFLLLFVSGGFSWEIFKMLRRKVWVEK